MNATCHLGREFGLLMMALVLAVSGATSMAFARDIDGDGLRAVHEKAAARYSDVRQISAKELATLRLNEVRAPLIFDVREQQEYAVSHLADANQVKPDITAADFLSTFGKMFQGRTVIVYCSVGVRSMHLAARVQVAVKSAGAQAIYNLAGGVFNWHNQSRPLANKGGLTDLVHPYNWRWSRLVKRRKLISYKAVARR